MIHIIVKITVFDSFEIKAICIQNVNNNESIQEQTRVVSTLNDKKPTRQCSAQAQVGQMLATCPDYSKNVM